MSFGPAPAAGAAIAEGPAAFLAAAVELAEAAVSSGPLGHGRVLEGDARDLACLGDERFDRVVTSPPYPNRMSYVRELRPYMYWLGYLNEAREAGELDWRAIGGTWGVATSRLAHFTPREGVYRPPALVAACAAVAAAHPKNGVLLSRYLLRYFEDTFAHLGALTARLTAGAEVDYIVGNSTFYNVLVPVEEIYAAMLAELGFERVAVETIRKRNSKKALYEFRVSGRWGRRTGPCAPR
jgi:hypothetical protein